MVLDYQILPLQSHLSKWLFRLSDRDIAYPSVLQEQGTLWLCFLHIPVHRTLGTEETRTITAIASDTSLTVNGTFTDNGNDATPEIHTASFVVTDDSNGIDFLIDTNGNIETSTTGKVKQKGAFMQSSTNQALVLGG